MRAALLLHAIHNQYSRIHVPVLFSILYAFLLYFFLGDSLDRLFSSEEGWLDLGKWTFEDYCKVPRIRLLDFFFQIRFSKPITI